MLRKIIIQSAVTGGQLPSPSPYLPITPEEIAQAIVESCKAGASIAHYHVRDPKTGVTVSSLEYFREVATSVKQQCDIVLCPTTAGGVFQGDERLDVIPELQPEVATFDLGPTMGPDYPRIKRLKDNPHYPWEREFVRNQYTFCDAYTYKRMEIFGQTMAKYGTKPEIEIFSPRDIDFTTWMLSEGIVNRPLYLQFVIAPGEGCIEYLLYLHRAARENLGDFNFLVVGIGKDQMRLLTTGLSLGGHVRVGLEDALRDVKGELVKSSAEQVSSIVKIIKGIGWEIASPNEARQILGFKGMNKVNF